MLVAVAVGTVVDGIVAHAADALDAAAAHAVADHDLNAS